MKDKEIDEEKATIFNSDGEDYDESNFLEENTVAITLDKMEALARKWQQDQESDLHLVSANPNAQPLLVSTIPIRGRGCVGQPFLERIGVRALNTTADCRQLR